MSKYHADGYRLCDMEDCEFPATHTLVWEAHQCYCLVHANGMLNLAHHMGFPTPKNTVRKMTIDEMMPDELPAAPSPARSNEDTRP